jgi:hypothetical protein
MRLYLVGLDSVEMQCTALQCNAVLRSPSHWMAMPRCNGLMFCGELTDWAWPCCTAGCNRHVCDGGRVGGSACEPLFREGIGASLRFGWSGSSGQVQDLWRQDRRRVALFGFLGSGLKGGFLFLGCGVGLRGVVKGLA